MRAGTRLGICLAGALLTAGLGCGGQLATDAGVSSGTGSGGGSGGWGGLGGDGAPAGGSGGGSFESAVYDWGGATVWVEPGLAAGGSFALYVSDEAGASAPSPSFNYPATTRWEPTDGAGVIAAYTCTSPGLYEVQLVSCPDQTKADRKATAPGCLVAIFSPDGVTGNFVDPNGASCDIVSGTASLHLSTPQWTPPPDGASPPGASGGVMLDCARSDGTRLLLDGRFVLPLQSWTLAC